MLKHATNLIQTRCKTFGRESGEKKLGMELKGKYKKSEFEFFDCTISIENGIIHRVIAPIAKPIEYFTLNPKNNAEFEYYKLPTNKGFVPIDSNYKIEYENKNGEMNTVFLNLSKWDIFCLKGQQKRHWIQKTDNWSRIVIPIITGVIVYLITRGIYGC
uniref:hypothetical protein n=2 Tax=Gelidibacter sp. TaxID=2018083 RepID=UPI004049DDB4